MFLRAAIVQLVGEVKDCPLIERVRRYHREDGRLSPRALEHLRPYYNQQALRNSGVRPANFFMMAMANEIC